MAYESRKLVSDDGPNKGGTNSGPWANIRSRSTFEFVNKVAAFMGAPQDRAVRQMLYDAVFSDGSKPVRYQGIAYTGPMLLSMYYRNDTGRDEHVPFTSRAQWVEFAEAMRKLRDPNIEVYGNADLLRLGESIEARQMPTAVSKGWA